MNVVFVATIASFSSCVHANLQNYTRQSVHTYRSRWNCGGRLTDSEGLDEGLGRVWVGVPPSGKTSRKIWEISTRNRVFW